MTRACPEPAWWQRAREMRGRGVSTGVIRRLLGREYSSILYATDEAFRERHKTACKRRYIPRGQK